MEIPQLQSFAVINVWTGDEAKAPPPRSDSHDIRVVCMSDTHGFHEKHTDCPRGDILIHAGDFTNYGSASEIARFASWLSKLPHPHKVVVAGNHEYGLDTTPSIFNQGVSAGAYDSEEISIADATSQLQRACTFLNNSTVTIMGLAIYGSPISVGMGAFGIPRGSNRSRQHWETLPQANIVITHGPPADILSYDRFGRDTGDENLRSSILRTKPLLHCFGHIHESYGAQELSGVWFINAAITSKTSPVVIDIAPQPR